MKIKQQYRDLFFSLINQLWRIISGPITMLLIPLFLTATQQGYWYLFASISSLSAFADLGFTNIIMQFTAHEFAFLRLGSDRRLIGESQFVGRLGSLLVFSMKWLLVFSMIVFPLIFIIGILYFRKDGVVQVYLLPWILFSLGSLLSFINSALLSFMDGLNQIEGMQKIRICVSIINTGIVVLLLVLKAGLFAASFGIFLSSLFVYIVLYKNYYCLFSQLLTESKKNSFPWLKEVLPLFTRYALSFSTGYFIYQIYVPVIHYLHGPIMSGRTGITISLIIALFNISNTWITTVAPKINVLVSRKDWNSLDALFNKRVVMACLTYLVGSAFILMLFSPVFRHVLILNKILARFLPLESLIVIMLCYFFQVIINAVAIYLRAHKCEPLLVYSIITGIFVSVSTIILGKYFNVNYFFFGFLSCFAFGIPWVLRIFFQAKRRWHIKV